MGRVFPTEADLRARLAALYEPAEIDQWFTLPHSQLGGRTARQVIDGGGMDEVEAIIERLETGAYL